MWDSNSHFIASKWSESKPLKSSSEAFRFLNFTFLLPPKAPRFPPINTIAISPSFLFLFLRSVLSAIFFVKLKFIYFIQFTERCDVKRTHDRGAKKINCHRKEKQSKADKREKEVSIEAQEEVRFISFTTPSENWTLFLRLIRWFCLFSSVLLLIPLRKVIRRKEVRLRALKNDEKSYKAIRRSFMKWK